MYEQKESEQIGGNEAIGTFIDDIMDRASHNDDKSLIIQVSMRDDVEWNITFV